MEVPNKPMRIICPKCGSRFFRETWRGWSTARGALLQLADCELEFAPYEDPRYDGFDRVIYDCYECHHEIIAPEHPEDAAGVAELRNLMARLLNAGG